MVLGLIVFDMMVLLLFGVGVVFGMMCGFVSEVFFFVVWIVGIVVVKLFYVFVVVLFEKLVGSVGGVLVLVVVLCFGLVFIVMWFIGN